MARQVAIIGILGRGASELLSLAACIGPVSTARTALPGRWQGTGSADGQGWPNRPGRERNCVALWRDVRDDGLIFQQAFRLLEDRPLVYPTELVKYFLNLSCARVAVHGFF